ncbi:MAG: GTP-binding protein [Castellaniella sp.]|uniref:AAA family ATPase n=1 Tax=Castellaniella sp. TaxID=1955812 RepID=UPI0012025305|nr:AAA family ATPase [Castellaniella sp.]TAN31129.1 MAG: GTP-binding protein [Castellaniella sp.]
MKLRRLCIEQFRQFREPLQIEDFAPGVNLFVGPNESGKSTVVRAIRAAFFERCKSSSVEDLLPWGDSSASPSVTLEFDWQGERWKLAKRFLKQKRCDLEIDGRRFSGEEAEDRLADLMGYHFSGRGASKAEHWGIPGLLWIEQGMGQDIQSSVQYAGDYLKSVLGESLGEVASSAGDALIARVEQEWLKLVTAKKHSPTGEYADVLNDREVCRTRLDALNAEIDGYREQVDRLADLRSQLIADVGRPWESSRAQAAQAAAHLAEVQGWRQAQQQDGQTLQQMEASRQLCLDQLDAFVRQKDELAERDRTVERAVASVQDQEARQPVLQACLKDAQDAYEAAEAVFGRARQHERRVLLRHSLQRLERDQDGVQDRLKRSRALLEQLRLQRSELQTLRMDAASLKRLRSLIQEGSQLDVMQQSLATRLRFDLQPERHLDLGSDVLEGQGERLLLEPTDLELPGLGRLQILPGGQDLPDLARRRQAAQAAVQECLAELRVTDLLQAEAVAERRNTLQGDIRHAETMLKTLAPEGVESLVAQQAKSLADLQAARADLAALPAADGDDALPVASVAEVGRDMAREALKAAEGAAAGGEQDLNLARQALTSARAESQRLGDLLRSSDRQAQEKALNLRLIEQNAQMVSLQDAIDGRRAQIDAAHPDILEQDVQRLNASADAQESAAERRRQDLAGLQGRLEALGAAGLEEQQAECAQRFQYLDRRCTELEQRSAALGLLLELLQSRRQALTLRIQAPLQRHLQHYLQLLFGRSNLTVDENLVPETLVRGERDTESRTDYESLSFGAREQMGLISRLAYADLLQEAGRPTLIILDDALVHSDATRLSQMKRILFDAGQRHQILLFSCHPDNWRDLGVAAVEMESLKRSVR